MQTYRSSSARKFVFASYVRILHSRIMYNLHCAIYILLNYSPRAPSTAGCNQIGTVLVEMSSQYPILDLCIAIRCTIYLSSLSLNYFPTSPAPILQSSLAISTVQSDRNSSGRKVVLVTESFLTVQCTLYIVQCKSY